MELLDDINDGNMEITTGIFWVALIGVGLYLGKSITEYVDSKGTKSRGVANVPLIGSTLDFHTWMPKNNHEKNIIANKVLVLAYTLMGVAYPILFIFMLPAIFYHIHWWGENA